ncbi:hypothetical protein Goshw_008518 [Gossypium schwendimanii]|uniref:Uncharacterized protein n=1 Tax=Gossypium schwendimanii TaxID=34291 RepID=A0A7J9LUZ0_GOSSC|nr:hypothetical protein [Gossypium schwendimanii]
MQCEIHIWSHKEVEQLKTQNFPYHEKLTVIYAKDRAIRKDVQIGVNIAKELQAQDVVNERIRGERNNGNRCEIDLSLDEMNVSAT